MNRPVVMVAARGAALVVLVFVAGVSLDRAIRLRYDFHHFYFDARRAWTHGVLEFDAPATQPEAQRQLPFYLPAVPALLAPLTAAGQVPAAIFWTLAQVAALAYCLRVAWRWCAEDGEVRGAGGSYRARSTFHASGRETVESRKSTPSPAPVPESERSTAAALEKEHGLVRGAKGFVLVLLLAAYAIYEAARFNQVSFFVLALVLAGVDAIERRRPSAGLWLAAATVLKLLPGVFAIWLILKRAWRALAVYVLVGLVLSLVPCVIAFGPARTVAYYRQWWVYNVVGMVTQGPDAHRLAGHFVDHRNQSIAAVVGRLCERGHPAGVARPLLQLDAVTARRTAQLIAGVLGLVLILLTRKPAARLTAWAVRAEASAYLIAMLVFAPLLRQYYLVWALPALVVLIRWASGGTSVAARCVAWAGLAVWTLGQVAWLSEFARACGAHLGMLIVLTATLLAGRPAATRVTPPAQSAMA